LLEQLQKEFEEKNHILENLRNSFADLNEIQKEIENLQSELIATNISIEKQTEEVTNIERLCEHLHDIRNVSETHKEVYSQKDSINKIEEEIKRLKKELTNKFPQLSDFNGVEVNEDITKYRAYLSNIDQLKNETDKIILQKDEIIEQIRNNYQIYANAGKEFYQDLTKLKELEETKAPKLTNIKKLMENYRDFKNKYLMQSMGFYTSIIVFSIIAMFVFDAFTLSFSSVLTGGFIFFVVATFIIYYWVLNPMKKVLKEMDSQISVSEAELMKSRIEIDELLSKYFNVPELENYEHHFKNIEAYELLNQNISEIDTKLNLLDIQMNKSEIQEMMAVIKNKYEGVIDFSDENLDENIERFIEIQQELKAKQEALETHKKSDYLNDRDHELTVEIAKTNTLVQEILRDSPHLQRFVDDAAKLNEELRKSEQQLEKLGAKQNAIESDLKEKKLVLARMEGNEDIDMERIVEDIQQIEEQIDYLSKKRSALAVVITTLESSVEEYNRIYKDSLNQRMNKYFEKIIGHDRFTVKLDDKFQLNIYHEDDIIPEESLSLGTRDQLYLSMRLAFSEEIAGDTNLPFFLDDPFVNCDEERLKCIKNILHDINKEHQVVIFSIDQKYSDWGKNVIYLKNE